MLIRYTILLVLTFQTAIVYAQDSTEANLATLSPKYLEQLSKKTDKYYSQVTTKTEKTLERLSHWENKIKTILEKTSPETAQRLFGNGQLTFSLLLQKYKEGKVAADGYKATVDDYMDKQNTSLKYLEEKKNELDTKLIQPLKTAKGNVDRLNSQLANTEAVQQFIKERKKLLLQQAVRYIGKSKYLQKISKKSYYYIETIRNYKEIFNTPGKAEEMALNLLKKIPAFNQFMEQNGMLSSLFGSGSNAIPAANYTALGYQSNAMISQQIQQRGLGGPNSIQSLTQTNAGALNSPLQELKNRFPGLSSTDDMPDFKPNPMKSKTLKQRLKFGANFQFGKATNYLPGVADMGIQLAYILNGKSSIGLGTSYKAGLGTGWNNIKLSSEGAALRSFLDWRIKGNFFANGGFEYNYNNSFRSLRDLPVLNNTTISLWKPSALLGISKKYTIGKMKGSLMLLYDFLGKQKIPQTQSLIFRFAYNFK